MRKILIGALMLAAAGCSDSMTTTPGGDDGTDPGSGSDPGMGSGSGSDMTPVTPDAQQDYDDVAAALGASTSVLENGAMADGVNFAYGRLPAGSPPRPTRTTWSALAMASR